MRLRILELPLETVGEVTTTPFVFVLDQVDTELLQTHDGEVVGERLMLDFNAAEICEQTGARGLLAFKYDVDLG